MYKAGDQIRLTSYIRRYLPPELLVKIERTTRRYDLNNNQKGKIVMRLLEDHLTNIGVDFRLLGKGTNRMGVQIDDLAFKFALDSDGHIDNKREFKYSNELQPYVIKVYECTEDGLVAVSEFVQCFDDYEYMLQCADEIRDILRKVSDYYFIGDVGITSKNAANWGKRRNGELVMLDFAYIYSVSYRLFTCTCNAGEILHYNNDYTSLVCPACKRVIEFAQIRRRISKKDQENEIGDLTKQSYILHEEVEYQKVNPAVSEVEEEPSAEEKELRRKRKMAKKNKNKDFDKRMEEVDDLDQIDMMTNLLMGNVPEATESDYKDEDEIGDVKAGEELLLQSLTGALNTKKNIDVDDIPDDPGNSIPTFDDLDDDFEPDSPADLGPSDYMQRAIEYASKRKVENNFGNNPLDDAEEEEEAPKEEPVAEEPAPAPVEVLNVVEPVEEEPSYDIEVDTGSEEPVEEKEEEEVEETPAVEPDTPLDPGYNFPQISAINRMNKILEFKRSRKGSFAESFFVGPDITRIKKAHTSGESHNNFISQSGIADVIMLMTAATTKPAIICDGEQMDRIIFPSDVERAISVFNTERFKIVEIMGDREVAPSNPKKRFFAIYDVGNSVKFLNKILDDFCDRYGDEAVSDYILAMLAQLRLKVEIGDVEYCPTSMVDVWDTNGNPSLSSIEECIAFNMSIMNDPDTVMADNEDEVYSLNVSEWGMDEHDSDIVIFEEIFDLMVPQVAETMQNYTGGYEGIGSDELIKGILTYSKFRNSPYTPAEPVPAEDDDDDLDVSEEEDEEVQDDQIPNEEYDETDPDEIDFPDDNGESMIIDTVHRP